MARTAPARQTQSRDGFVFSKYAGSLRWAVHVDSADPHAPTHIGYAWPNGSRMKSRSWDWQTVGGVQGKSSSRHNAAEALARQNGA